MKLRESWRILFVTRVGSPARPMPHGFEKLNVAVLNCRGFCSAVIEVRRIHWVPAGDQKGVNPLE